MYVDVDVVVVYALCSSERNSNHHVRPGGPKLYYKHPRNVFTHAFAFHANASLALAAI